MEKTNKCGVQFPCYGSIQTCEFCKTDWKTKCESYVEGNCTNRQAQIKALQDEGFEVKNG